jgi:hypothetical protein
MDVVGHGYDLVWKMIFPTGSAEPTLSQTMETDLIGDREVTLDTIKPRRYSDISSCRPHNFVHNLSRVSRRRRCFGRGALTGLKTFMTPSGIISVESFFAAQWSIALLRRERRQNRTALNPLAQSLHREFDVG